MTKLEILAPAGNLEKFKTALIYGADAVYFGLPGFSLRARASQFKKDEIREGVQFCRKMKKKFYVALNIYAHNIHVNNLDKQLEFIGEIKPDGVILSDPGILRMVKKELPNIDIHISTQANVTNKEAAKFWAEQGAKRIILAREVSLKEIGEIKKAVPEVELECFVHGAMCMAYSGRCILSKWMLNRSGNLGDCAQPCRWAYHKNKNKKDNELKIAGIVDDKDRFEIDIEEDEDGTYLFNSNDICLIEHLEKLREAGIESFKIEGRTKSIYYVAMVTKAYKSVIENPSEKNIIRQKEELEKLSNRGYWTGFMFENEPPHLSEEASREAIEEFVGISLFESGNINSKKREVFVHNHFKQGDVVEVVTPTKVFKNKIVEIRDCDGVVLDSAHGGQGRIFLIKFENEVEGFFVLRKTL